MKAIEYCRTNVPSGKRQKGRNDYSVQPVWDITFVCINSLEMDEVAGHNFILATQHIPRRSLDSKDRAKIC